MKFIFFAYNFYTLYLSYVYSKELKKMDVPSELLWRETLTKLPKGAYTAIWDSIKIIHLPHEEFSWIRRFASTFKITDLFDKLVTFTYLVKYFLLSKEAQFYLVVFKDDNPFDKIAINFFKGRSFLKKIVLIEEGTDLYSEKKLGGKQSFKQRLKNNCIMSVKPYHINQGENSKVDIIIANFPELLSSKKTANKKYYTHPGSVFSKKNSINFLKDLFLLKENDLLKQDRINYLYVGQPLAEDGWITSSKELDAIKQLATHLSSNGTLIIKPHIRDPKNKYDHIINEFSNVISLEDNLSLLPVELLFDLLGRPIFMTPFSSAGINIALSDENALVFFIFKLFSLNTITNELPILVKSPLSNIKVINNYKEMQEEIHQYREGVFVQQNQNNSQHKSEFSRLLSMVIHDK